MSNLLDVIKKAEETTPAIKNSSVSSSVTLFKSSLFKKGKRTETSLIDETIITACKELHAEGITEVSYFALNALFQTINYPLKKRDRIYAHIHAESKKEHFAPFLRIESEKIIFKDALYQALELEVPEEEKAPVKRRSASKK